MDLKEQLVLKSHIFQLLLLHLLKRVTPCKHYYNVRSIWSNLKLSVQLKALPVPPLQGGNSVERCAVVTMRTRQLRFQSRNVGLHAIA